MAAKVDLRKVKDQATKETFSAEECDWLLDEFLSAELFRRGLICRADDRGDPVIQLSPPLVADSQQFEEIEGILRDVLTRAADQVRQHAAGRPVPERHVDDQSRRHARG